MKIFLLLYLLITASAYADGLPKIENSPDAPAPSSIDRDFTNRVKLFIQHSKGALVFSSAGDNNGRALNIYPAAKPSYGVSFLWNRYFSISYARSIAELSINNKKPVASNYQHFEAHVTQSIIAVDAHALQYRGLYALSQPKQDVRPFQDSIFIGNSGATMYPNLRMKSMGLGATLNLDKAEIDLASLMNQKKRIKQSDWGRLFMLQLRNTEFSNDTPINQDGITIEDGSIAGLAMGPGVVGHIVNENWYLGGGAVIALAATQSSLSDQTYSGFGSSYSLRGSMGFNDGVSAYGLNGIKNIMTIDRRAVSVTESVSQIELFYGVYF